MNESQKIIDASARMSISSEEGFSANLEANGDDIELVFGLVGPTGVDLGKVFESLRTQLKSVNYEAVVVRLSDLIVPYLTGKSEKFKSEHERIKNLMEYGTTLRESTGQRDIVGRLGIANIKSIRKEKMGSEYKPIRRAAYIISSFKRPEEVQLFRDVYGKAFTLISVYAPRQSRLQDLARRLRSSVPKNGPSAEQLAVELINKDFEEEGRKLGQRVGRTFPLADYFVTSESKKELDSHILRLVKLTFGHPYVSPTKDEQGMYFAQAAALRSLDLSRQVGAAIVDGDGEILSTGCNEVAKFGGGLYWGEDKNPARDFELGGDINVSIKSEILEDLLTRLRKSEWLSGAPKDLNEKELAEYALFSEKNEFLKNSLLFDVIEFGRAVHAEAASITQAAKRGVAISGARLFCTTFPCHICARHILSSGISEVLFIEPYEKSRTGELYSDSISIEPQEMSSSRANFRAFVGVAPRRYIDCFQLTRNRKTVNGKILDPDEYAEQPRIKRIVLTYLLIEDIVIRDTIPVAQQVKD